MAVGTLVLRWHSRRSTTACMFNSSSILPLYSCAEKKVRNYPLPCNTKTVCRLLITVFKYCNCPLFDEEIFTAVSLTVVRLQQTWPSYLSVVLASSWSSYINQTLNRGEPWWGKVIEKNRREFSFHFQSHCIVTGLRAKLHGQPRPLLSSVNRRSVKQEC